MRHHHDFVSRHADYARRQIKRGLASAFEDAANNNPLAIVDVIREYLRPAAGGSFLELQAHERGRVIVDLLAQFLGNAENELSTQLMVAWQVIKYENAGERTYVASQGLSRQLLATELRGVRCEDLRLPYPSIYIAVDEGLGFTVYNQVTGVHPLYGVYVTEDESGWRLMLCGSGRGEDDALTHFHVNLEHFDTVDESLAALREHVMKKDSGWARVRGFGDEYVGGLIDNWFSVFRWVMNLVFYVTHVEPGDHVEANRELSRLRERARKTTGKKRERLLERARSLPSQRHIIVGKSVSGRGMPANTGEARTLLRKTLVAGHWQRYAVGVGRQERVWKFREPFWRGQGPETSAVHEVR